VVPAPQFSFPIKRVSYNYIHSPRLFIIIFTTISLLLLIPTLQQIAIELNCSKQGSSFDDQIAILGRIRLWCYV
jgi:hypothetical protein